MASVSGFVFFIWLGALVVHAPSRVRVSRQPNKHCPCSVPFTTVAVVDNGRAFISTSLLHLRVPHADLVALGALGIGVDPLRLHLVPFNSLNNRQLLPQRRGEIRRFRSCCDGLPETVCAWLETLAPTLPPNPRPTSVFRSAAVAMENILLAALGRRQKIAAVRAENQGTDRGHGDVAVVWSSFAQRNSMFAFPARRSTGFLQRNPPENLVEPASRKQRNPPEPPQARKHGPRKPHWKACEAHAPETGWLLSGPLGSARLPWSVGLAWDELQQLHRTFRRSTRHHHTRHGTSSTGNRVPVNANYTGISRAKDCRMTRH